MWYFLLQESASVDSIVSLAEQLSKLSGPVLILIGLYLLHKGIVVLGRELVAEREDKNFWRDTAIRALNIGEAVAARRNLTTDEESEHGGGN